MLRPDMERGSWGSVNKRRATQPDRLLEEAYFPNVILDPFSTVHTPRSSIYISGGPFLCEPSPHQPGGVNRTILEV